MRSDPTREATLSKKIIIYVFSLEWFALYLFGLICMIISVVLLKPHWSVSAIILIGYVFIFMGSVFNRFAVAHNNFKMPVAGRVSPHDYKHVEADPSTRYWWLCDWIEGRNCYYSPGDLMLKTGIIMTTIGGFIVIISFVTLKILFVR